MIALGGPLRLAKNRTKVSDQDTPGASVNLRLSIGRSGSLEVLASYRNLRAMRTNRIDKARTDHLVVDGSVHCISRAFIDKAFPPQKKGASIQMAVTQDDLHDACETVESIGKQLSVSCEAFSHRFGTWTRNSIETSSMRFSNCVDGFDQANSIDRDLFKIASAIKRTESKEKFSNRALSKAIDLVLSPASGVTCAEISSSVHLFGSTAIVLDGLERIGTSGGIDRWLSVDSQISLAFQNVSKSGTFEILQFGAK